jgi:protein O-GlcNAc transferase
VPELKNVQRARHEIQVAIRAGDRETAARILLPLLHSAELASGEYLHWLLRAASQLLTQDASAALIARVKNRVAENEDIALLCSNHLADSGNSDAAISLMQFVLSISPEFVRCWNNLTTLFLSQNKFAEAIDAGARSVALDPDYARGHANLAAAYVQLKQFEQAIVHCDQALRRDRSYAFAYRIRAVAQLGMNNWKGASVDACAALQLNQLDSESLYALAQSNEALGEPATALELYLRVLEIVPSHVGAMARAAESAASCGDDELAEVLWAKCLTIDPTHRRARCASLLHLPKIYRSKQHLSDCRQRLVAGLDALHDVETVNTHSQDKFDRAHELTLFELAYQGQNDLDLQRKFSSFLAAQINTGFRFAPFQSSRSRRRIGFASAFFKESVVGLYFHRWVAALSSGEFDVFVFSIGANDDEITRAISKLNLKWLDLQGSAAEIAETIAKYDLDLLVFPEVGMDARTRVLASVRVAQVQACAWGHPVTTGSSAIDYYLSVSSMEPQNCAAHYSEHVLMLPGIGTSYPSSATTVDDRWSRAQIGLSNDAVLLLVPQSLFKIHPDNDSAWAAIVSQVPNATLVFFQGEHQPITKRFSDRIGQAFKDARLDPNQVIKFLPRVSMQTFRAICKSSDLMLDTLYWSGGNTSLDAFSQALPVITLPGEFMRGRQTLGMYRQLNIESPIASCVDTYINEAVALARDSKKRLALRNRISQVRSKLYDDDEPLKALAQHVRDILRIEH